LAAIRDVVEGGEQAPDVLLVVIGVERDANAAGVTPDEYAVLGELRHELLRVGPGEADVRAATGAVARGEKGKSSRVESVPEEVAEREHVVFDALNLDSGEIGEGVVENG
jgi:hypothetical protein